jgi:hypothetical protein
VRSSNKIEVAKIVTEPLTGIATMEPVPTGSRLSRLPLVDGAVINTTAFVWWPSKAIHSPTVTDCKRWGSELVEAAIGESDLAMDGARSTTNGSRCTRLRQDPSPEQADAHHGPGPYKLAARRANPNDGLLINPLTNRSVPLGRGARW